jgi:ABC-type proline/glycine betaine transport system substrate-binding protein
VGWTDITATTAATTVVLDALGYDTDMKVMLTYSLATGCPRWRPISRRIARLGR